MFVSRPRKLHENKTKCVGTLCVPDSTIRIWLTSGTGKIEFAEHEVIVESEISPNTVLQILNRDEFYRGTVTENKNVKTIWVSQNEETDDTLFFKSFEIKNNSRLMINNSEKRLINEIIAAVKFPDQEYFVTIGGQRIQYVPREIWTRVGEVVEKRKTGCIYTPCDQMFKFLTGGTGVMELNNERFLVITECIPDQILLCLWPYGLKMLNQCDGLNHTLIYKHAYQRSPDYYNMDIINGEPAYKDDFNNFILEMAKILGINDSTVDCKFGGKTFSVSSIVVDICGATRPGNVCIPDKTVCSKFGQSLIHIGKERIALVSKKNRDTKILIHDSPFYNRTTEKQIYYHLKKESFAVGHDFSGIIPSEVFTSIKHTFGISCEFESEFERDARIMGKQIYCSTNKTSQKYIYTVIRGNDVLFTTTDSERAFDHAEKNSGVVKRTQLA